ncbi:MAG: hypothetical protein IIA50_00640 [Bacteroidetes bacterium]|nr:hypothetical protein [Bacteroidota bacterium]
MPDTTVARDSLVTSGRSAGFFSDVQGEAESFASPRHRAELDLPALLASSPGFFSHTFGSPGWPGAPSPFGLDPNLVGLSLDGLPFEDLNTGRPRYDLIPYGLVDSVRTNNRKSGRVLGFHATTGTFDPGVPRTNLRYQSSNIGLQAVDAVHAQTRLFSLTGPGDRIDFVVGYAGAGAAGEYPGSRLRRARRMFTRLRLDHGSWSAEIFELYNRRHLGAHAGVVALAGRPQSSIYQRLGASVRNEEAKRTTIRNDLSLRLRVFALRSPVTVTGFWTTQTLQYRSSSDTLTTRLHRIGGSFHQDYRSGRHRLSLAGMAWVDRFRSGNGLHPDAIPSTGRASRSYFELTVSDSTGIGRLRINAGAGLHSDDGNAFPSVSLAIRQDFDAVSIRIEAGYTGLRSSWIDRYGFGPTAGALPEVAGPRLMTLQGHIGTGFRSFGLSVTGFVSRLSNGIVRTINGSTLEGGVHVLSNVVQRTGASLDISFRRESTSGIYVFIRPTLIRIESGESEGIGLAEESSVPDFWVTGRMGIRTLLFSGDLDLDLSVRGTYWQKFSGRRLDPRTGLLILPVNDPREVPASGTVEIVAEAGVRTATLFLSYDNILSGTGIMAGNLLIPDYPLPAQRFRFGVFWPILN